MSARVGFTPDDAERQAGAAAARYLNCALQTIAERFGLEKSLVRDPARLALEFQPLLIALIGAQSREYMTWTLHARLGEIAGPLAEASHELSAWITLHSDMARGAEGEPGAPLQNREGQRGRT